MIKFSIVTPSFNNSDWLKLCIASIADQELEHEHIVQDAGSDDGTLEWLSADRRVRAFAEKDAGLYDALNRGLRKANGDVISFLNCDEQYLPGALKSVNEFFAARPDVEIVFGDTVAVNAEGEYLWHRKLLRPRLWHTWAFHLSALSCGTFYRRSVFEGRGRFFDTSFRYVADTEWMVRLIREGVPMAELRRFTSVFTHTGSNLSMLEKAQKELRDYNDTAPPLARRLKPLVLMHHRVRRLVRGVYSQQPFDFALYTKANPNARVVRRAGKPTFRWKW